MKYVSVSNYDLTNRKLRYLIIRASYTTIYTSMSIRICDIEVDCILYHHTIIIFISFINLYYTTPLPLLFV